jgi:anti-sigma regulatory factor (Ser/Thr protein kinase)
VELVRHACQDMDFGARQLMLNVPVALTEALSNAILRGNADDPAKQVRVRAGASTSMPAPSIRRRPTASRARRVAGCF